MSFFNGFVQGNHSATLLIDVGSGSVAAGYLLSRNAKKNTLPILVHGVRRALPPSHPGVTADDIKTTLSSVLDTLIKEGAPRLREHTGTGRVSSVLVSFASPWQKTSVKSEHKTASEPFTFTKHLLDELLATGAGEHADAVLTGSSVLATKLNGYAIHNPIGKRITRAEVVLLGSYVERAAIDAVVGALKSTHHIDAATYKAFPEIAFHTLHSLYPHEKDYVIIDAAMGSTDVALVMQGILSHVESVTVGVGSLLTRSIGLTTEAVEQGVHVIRDTGGNEEHQKGRDAWVAGLVKALQALSGAHALPRRIFLFSDNHTAQTVRQLLDDPSIRKLWLTDEPLSVVLVAGNQFTSVVKAEDARATDAFLLTLGYYAEYPHTQESID